MLDDIFEGFLEGIGRVIGYIFIQVLFEFVFYYIGYPFVKILTLGSYPKPRNKDYLFLETETRQGFFTSVFGLIITIAAIVTFYFYKTKGTS